MDSRYVSVCQYSENNVTHFLFNLLRIKGLYMFRALLVHPQEALHKRNLIYCMRVISVGCTKIGVAPIPAQPTAGAGHKEEFSFLHRIETVRATYQATCPTRILALSQ
jgi:hypothetical protein